MTPSAFCHRPRRLLRPLCVIPLSLLVLSGGCKGKTSAGGSDARMPITDGQYLTYAVSLDGGSQGHLDDNYKYEFKDLDNARWQVVGSTGEYHTGSGSSYTIDKNATVLAQDQSEFSKWKVGRPFSDLWLSPDDRQNGKVTHPLDDMGDFAVGPETVWQRWRVVPAVSAGMTTKKTRYYEVTTGWLVGTELKTDDGKSRVDSLTDTSLSIPAQ
jgi:hypothetical protein